MVEKLRIGLVYSQIYDDELPLGISMLDSFLTEKGYDVNQIILQDLSMHIPGPLFIRRLIEYTMHKTNYRYSKSGKYSPFLLSLDRMIEKIDPERYGILGFSVISNKQLNLYMALARRIKERFKTTIVFGGPYITLCHDLVSSKHVDFFVLADGELAMLGLAKHITGIGSLDDVPSIRYMKDGKWTINPPASPETLPLPRYDTDLLNKIKSSRYSHNFGLPYELSKGCPNRCSFCSYWQLGKPQQKLIPKIIDDLKKIKKDSGFNRFRFVDSSINWDKGYLIKLCKAIIDEKLDIEWVTFATPNIPRDILALMKDAGCTDLMYGVETGSQKINHAMRKPFNVDTAARCLKESSEAGINNLIELIVGFPWEQKSDVKATIDMMINNKEHITDVFINRFQLFYGSYIQKNPEEFKITLKGKVSKINMESYRFDEAGGLAWKKRQRQTTKHINMMAKIFKRHDIRYHISERII